jgi:ribosomal protein S18 acetylase RimI-like enzyme
MATIRRARPEDWPIAREVRLAALAESPDAFGATLEDALSREEASWRAWTEGSFVQGDATMFLAFPDEGGEEAVGIVVGARIDGGDADHRPDEVQIWSMWVAPEARRQGVASALIEAVLTWARGLPGVVGLVLRVTVGNDAAEAAYRAAGFVVDPDAPLEPLRPGSPLVEQTMRRPLAP